MKGAVRGRAPARMPVLRMLVSTDTLPTFELSVKEVHLVKLLTEGLTN